MNQAQKQAILAGGAALHKYERGDSLTDEEMVKARDFAELLATLSQAHPDCRVFRLYGTTASMLNDFVRERGSKRV